jgi:hypothetical protein
VPGPGEPKRRTSGRPVALEADQDEPPDLASVKAASVLITPTAAGRKDTAGTATPKATAAASSNKCR